MFVLIPKGSTWVVLKVFKVKVTNYVDELLAETCEVENLRLILKQIFI